MTTRKQRPIAVPAPSTSRTSTPISPRTSLPEPTVTINSEFEFRNQEALQSSAQELKDKIEQPVSNPILYFRLPNPKSAIPPTSTKSTLTPTSNPIYVSPASASKKPPASNPVFLDVGSTVDLNQTEDLSTLDRSSINIDLITASSSPASSDGSGFLTVGGGRRLDEREDRVSIESVASSSSLSTLRDLVSSSVSGAPIINIVPTSTDQDSIYFGENSYLMIPINQELSEKTTGLELERWEKPGIISVISEISSFGYSTANIIFVKKLISSRAAVKKYKIFRKDVFKESDYKVIKELTPEEISLSPKYISAITSIGFSKGQVFSYEDRDIKKHSTYIYKIEVSWISTGPPPPKDFNFFNVYFPVTSGTIAWSFVS